MINGRRRRRSGRGSRSGRDRGRHGRRWLLEDSCGRSGHNRRRHDRWRSHWRRRNRSVVEPGRCVVDVWRVLGRSRPREHQLVLRLGSEGLERGRRPIPLTDRRASPECHVPRAVDPNPILQLFPIEAPGPRPGGRRDRRPALRAEGRRRRRAMAGRAPNLPGEGGGHTAAGYMRVADVRHQRPWRPRRRGVSIRCHRRIARASRSGAAP